MLIPKEVGHEQYITFAFTSFSTYFLCGHLGLAISVFAFGRRGLRKFFLWT